MSDSVNWERKPSKTNPVPEHVNVIADTPSDRPPVSGEPSHAIQRLLDYSWGLHLAGTPNEAEAIGLIEAARAEARASAPLDVDRARQAFDAHEMEHRGIGGLHPERVTSGSLQRVTSGSPPSTPASL